jgi:hypothetical protein
MLRAFIAAIALAAGVGGEGTQPAVPLAPERPPAAVLGIVWNETEFAKPELTRVKSVALEPVGRRVPLRLGGGSATAYSPDRRWLAVGNGTTASIQLIDLRRMKQVGVVKLGLDGWVTFLFWQRGLLFAVVDGDGSAAIALVDPAGRQVLHRHRLSGTVIGAQVGSEDGTGQIVLLTAPQTRIGPVSLSVVGGKDIESVSVSGISGGWETENDSNGYRARQATPGLAIDAQGSRAFIIPAGRTVAEVSLGDLAVTYHALSEPVSLLRRLRNWLEPTAQAKLIEGPQRKAVWLESGLIAVTGVDYSVSTNENGEPDVAAKAAGLSLIDTRTWAIRKIDDEASDFARFENTLLAFGVTDWGGSSTPPGFGLVGYDLGGKELFHALEGTGVSWVEAVGGLAYVTLNEKLRVVVEAATGHVFGRTRTKKPLSLVTN